MRTYPGIPRSPATTTRYVFFIIAGVTTFAMPVHSFRSADLTVGHFDLDVQRSKALTLGKSHVETVSAFVTYTDRFFGGRTNALSIHLYAAPIDAATRARLLANSKDDLEVSRVGAAYLTLFVDKQNRITQVNLTYIVPGTTVAATVAYLPDDLAKEFSEYRYANGRLRLKSKGRYVPGSVSPDDEYTLSWDVNLDVAVVDRISAK